MLKVYLNLQGTENILEKRAINIDYPISEIQVTGNSLVSANTILDLVQIKPGEFYNKLKAEVNRQKILEMGLFEAAGVSTVVSGNGLVVVFTVKENPVIKHIEVVGSVEFSAEEMLKQIGVEAGATYTCMSKLHLHAVHTAHSIVTLKRVLENQTHPTQAPG